MRVLIINKFLYRSQNFCLSLLAEMASETKM